MPVPNTLTRIINKYGEIVNFDLSRIQNAIANAIIDVEHVSGWEAKERAIKYAEVVRDNIYRNFYDINYLCGFFGKMIESWRPEEREERIMRQEFAPRLTTLLLLYFKHFHKCEHLMEEHLDSLHKMIYDFFKSHISDLILVDLCASLFCKKVYDKDSKGLAVDDQYPHREFIQDMIEQTLKNIGEIALSEGFMIFREGKRKIKSSEITEAQFTHNGIHYDRLRQTLMWNIRNECDSVFALNDWVMGRGGKDFKDLMQRSDERFYDEITKTVEKILQRIKDIKVVIIAGPSCSNKTTITTIIEQELSKSGLHLKQLNVDDYFYSLSQHPKDEYGDYDYEMPEAIDIPLLNQNLKQLIEGRPIQKPIYNFKTGNREKYVEFKVENDEIILIDCLHGLYKPLTEAVPPTKKFKIYTESANMLRGIDGSYTLWSDVRLAKRMIRDSLYRYYDIAKTLEHWFYVRKGELKHIIPYIYSVDVVLNSGLPYELPILKAVLHKKLPSLEYLNSLRDQGRLDAYIRGLRLITLFESIIAYENIDDVSSYSPLREFIGGSAYKIAHNE